jgi:Flp pilus assembly protein TadD
MANPFLSSEEYDERAHRLYDNGDYEGALETLKEGIQLYPHSVELYVGLGYTRLAREEYAWARQDFERALVLDGEHEDALVGQGEVMLRFGRRHDALAYFEKARETGCSDDLDLLLSMGRALYRERMFEHAREVFVEAVRVHRDSAEALAALGYTLHRLSDETGARRELRSSLELDPELYVELGSTSRTCCMTAVTGARHCANSSGYRSATIGIRSRSGGSSSSSAPSAPARPAVPTSDCGKRASRKSNRISILWTSCWPRSRPEPGPERSARMRWYLRIASG